MLLVREILGDRDEERFAGRMVEKLHVSSHDASKRRLRALTDGGTDVAVDLERGSYLRHGAVLADDGERIVVVERTPEETLIVRLSAGLERDELLAQAVRLGHAFGNQHVSLETVNGEIRIPITTSRDIAAATVRALGLEGAEIDFALVRLGLETPLAAPAHQH